MTRPPSEAVARCSVCHTALNPDMQRDGMCSTCYRLTQEATPSSVLSEQIIRDAYQSGRYAADWDEGRVWSRPGFQDAPEAETEDEVVARLLQNAPRTTP